MKTTSLLLLATLFVGSTTFGCSESDDNSDNASGVGVGAGDTSSASTSAESTAGSSGGSGTTASTDGAAAGGQAGSGDQSSSGPSSGGDAPSSAGGASNDGAGSGAAEGAGGGQNADGAGGGATTEPDVDGPGAGEGGGANEGSGGAGGASDGAGGAGMPEGAGGSATDPDQSEAAVHYVGRFDQTDAEAMRFEWSGSGVVAAFQGTSVSVNLEDTGSNEFTVVVDGELQDKLVADAGENTYALAAGLADGEHIVEVYRRTEASFGPSTFLGFDFGADGALLPPPPPPAYKLEVIGDSISCGYGNEGDSATCGFSADTENHYMTYGAIAARALDAEVVTIAWSGKGIVYNYGEDTNDPLPALYDRILPSSSSAAWDFSVQPDAVVINLGTNDFSTDGDPSPDLFAGEYESFLSHLREVYPDTFILCTVGNLLNGDDLAAARAGIATAVAARNAAGDAQVEAWEMNVPNDDPGCDYHPSVPTHEAMADALVSELQSRLGW